MDDGGGQASGSLEPGIPGQYIAGVAEACKPAPIQTGPRSKESFRMKTASRLALAALLSTGVAGAAIVAPAASAQKKKDKAAGPQYSPDVVKAAQPAQAALQALDATTAEPLVVQAEAAAKTEDDAYIAAALRYNLEAVKISNAQKANPNAPVSEATLAKPLEALIASPKTPQADKAKYTYRRGALAFNAKQWPVALQYFNQAQQLGYQDPNLGLQIVRAKEGAGDTTGALTGIGSEIDRLTASGQKAPEDLYRYAIARSNARKMSAETVGWIRKYIAAYPTAKNWRDVLVTYGIQQQSVAQLDKSQKIDLFRLMRASGALNDQYDYEEYAQNVLDRGLPAEASAVLKEGQAAGKVPASSTNATMMLKDATNAIRLEGSLAGTETKARAAANGALASQTADAYLGQGNWAKAADLYRVALGKGVANADEVNTRLGIALARGGDKAGAGAAFAAVKGTPRADIAGLWTTWLSTQA